MVSLPSAPESERHGGVHALAVKLVEEARRPAAAEWFLQEDGHQAPPRGTGASIIGAPRTLVGADHAHAARPADYIEEPPASVPGGREAGRAL